MRVSLLLITLLICVTNSFALKITDRSQIKGQELEITEIDLSNMGLSKFPMEILKCENLESLKLSDNGIFKIPKELGELNHLVRIDLSGNQGLSYNDMEEMLATAEFQLVELNLENCEIGSLPYEIGRQKGLKKLNIAGNLLNNLPYSVVQLSKLEDLDVSNNRIEDMSWQVHQWWNLKRLNVSDNTGLKTTELLFSLSVFKPMEKLVISHVDFFPKEFADFDIAELEVRNSNVKNFPRGDESTQIKSLSFVNCRFKNTEQIVKVINERVSPEFLSVQYAQPNELIPFLKVEVDSIDIRNNNISNISALATIKKLEWVDARGNRIAAESVQQLKEARPEITLFLEDPIEKNVGVAPPIEKFIQEPITRRIQGDEGANVRMGNTSFDFPANSFITEDGEPFTGEVELSYSEYFTPEEILLSGITMTLEEDGEIKPFTSAGMFDINATDKKGNELYLNPNVEVPVEMISLNADAEMNVYSLNAQGEWDYVGKDEIQEPFKMDMSKIDSAANARFLDFKRSDVVLMRNRFVPVVKNNGRQKTFEFKFNELITEARSKNVIYTGGGIDVKRNDILESYIARTTFLYDGDVDSIDFYKKWLKKVRKESNKSYGRLRYKGQFVYKPNNFKWGINYIKDLSLNVKEGEDRIQLKFLYKDSLVAIPVVLKSNYANPKSRMKTWSKYFARYNRIERKRAKEFNKLNRELDKVLRKQEDEIKNRARDMEVARQLEMNGRESFTIQQVDRGSFIRNFALAAMGKTNLDHVFSVPRPAMMPRDFVADNGEKIKEKIERIMVVDFDFNSVVSYGNIKDVYFNQGGRSAIVVFFTGAIVGIYNTARKKFIDKRETLQLRMTDLESTTREDFINDLRQ